MEKKIFWNIPVPKPLDEAVEEIVSKDMHASKSEFVRDAVRRELERIEAARTRRSLWNNGWRR